jgi:hypothetical protein
MTQHAPGGRAAPTRRLPTYLLMGLVVLAGSSYVVVDKLTSTTVVQTERADSPGAQPAFVPAANTDVAPQRPVHMIGHVVTGDTLGLYGGTGTSACDVPMIQTFLATNPQPARAWAGALRISTGDIDRFLDSLTALTLRTDTAVTNHGYRDGVATPFPSVLQAGTAVLVDAEGLPRVRCYCGNPLQTPVPMENVRYEGPPWTGFEPESVTVIGRAHREVKEFVVLDHDSDQVVSRPRATRGEADEPANPEVQETVRALYQENRVDTDTGVDGEAGVGGDPRSGGPDPTGPTTGPSGDLTQYRLGGTGATTDPAAGNPSATTDPTATNPAATAGPTANPGTTTDPTASNPGTTADPTANPSAATDPTAGNPGTAESGPSAPSNPPAVVEPPPAPRAADPAPDETDGDTDANRRDGDAADDGDGGDGNEGNDGGGDPDAGGDDGGSDGGGSDEGGDGGD